MDLFEKSTRRTFSPYKGEAIHYSMKGRDGAYDEIMWRYEEPIPACPPIADYVSFYWHEVDHWYEEDEEVFVHARDPFRRIDCLPSRSEEHTSELQSLMRISSAVFCLKKKTKQPYQHISTSPSLYIRPH